MPRSKCVVLFSLQLEVATLILAPHIRSLANQFIQFNTTSNVGVTTHMRFCSACRYWPTSTLTHRLLSLGSLHLFVIFFTSLLCLFADQVPV